MLGLYRQFTFTSESCCRLPELALLLANILTYMAAVLPSMPTGFWDKRPKKVTEHLSKGVAAHRRQKASA